MSFTANEVKIQVEDFNHGEYVVQLWFVKGDRDIAYPIKLAAEVAAKQRYPNLDPNSMVYYMNFFRDYDV